MKDYSICEKCVSGNRKNVGKKCQACISNSMFEEKCENHVKLKKRNKNLGGNV